MDETAFTLAGILRNRACRTRRPSRVETNAPSRSTTALQTVSHDVLFDLILRDPMEQEGRSIGLLLEFP